MWNLKKFFDKIDYPDKAHNAQSYLLLVRNFPYAPVSSCPPPNKIIPTYIILCLGDRQELYCKALIYLESSTSLPFDVLP